MGNRLSQLLSSAVLGRGRSGLVGSHRWAKTGLKSGDRLARRLRYHSARLGVPMKRIHLISSTALVATMSLAAAPVFAEPPHSRAGHDRGGVAAQESGRATQGDRSAQT